MPVRLLASLALLVVLAGCQQTGSDSSASAKKDVPVITAPVAVAVIEARPYVLAGEESIKFLGTERGKWGERSPVETASGRPFAEVLAEQAAAILGQQGINAQPMPVKRKDTSEETVIATFLATGVQKLVLIRVREWNSESYTRVMARWNAEATVFDRSGTFLARRQTQGSEIVGDTRMQSDRDVGQTALQQRLRWLLSEPAILAALG